jgi:uncharacterized protein YdaU (DUF1376 family)
MKNRSGMPYDVVAFSTDERAMLFTLEEEGAFHRLLRHAWVNGSIPDDLSQLAKICRCLPSTMRKLWKTLEPMWPKDPMDATRRLNAKQETEREYRDVKSGKASESAAKRWQKERRAKSLRASSAVASNLQCVGNASHPIPSVPIPPPSPVDDSNTEKSFVPVEKRTVAKLPKNFQKFWGPVERHIRKNIEPESFQRYYSGIEVVGMTAQEIILAVPGAFIHDRCGDDRSIAATVLSVSIEKANSNFMRGRVLNIMSLEEKARGPG